MYMENNTMLFDISFHGYGRFNGNFIKTATLTDFRSQIFL